jgi:hypothetical protein
MELIAQVVSATGRTTHYIGNGEGLALMPLPRWVKIVEADDAFYLLYLDENLVQVTDTWHATLDEAKAQARFAFGTVDSDWAVCSPHA